MRLAQYLEQSENCYLHSSSLSSFRHPPIINSHFKPTLAQAANQNSKTRPTNSAPFLIFSLFTKIYILSQIRKISSIITQASTLSHLPKQDSHYRNSTYSHLNILLYTSLNYNSTRSIRPQPYLLNILFYSINNTSPLPY